MVASIKKRKAGCPRGQAMVEYSIISHFILFSGTLFLLPVIKTLLESISKFYDSVYAIIQTAAM
jgi:Flp pilus assembly pilin Flp